MNATADELTAGELCGEETVQRGEVTPIQFNSILYFTPGVTPGVTLLYLSFQSSAVTVFHAVTEAVHPEPPYVL